MPRPLPDGRYKLTLVATEGLHVRLPRPIDIQVATVACASSGARSIKVPDVRGRPLASAIRIVQRADLNVIGFGSADPVDSESRVWAQKPSGGEKVPQGACIGFRATDYSSSSLTVTAGPGLMFDRKQYTVAAGEVTIHFAGSPGMTLAFADPRFRTCLLGTDQGARHTCRVTLTPGNYEIYDVVPSHRAAGLEATINVPESGR
jgi:hypothetical protein